MFKIQKLGSNSCVGTFLKHWKDHYEMNKKNEAFPTFIERKFKESEGTVFHADFPIFQGGLKHSIQVIESNLDDCNKYGWNLYISLHNIAGVNVDWKNIKTFHEKTEDELVDIFFIDSTQIHLVKKYIDESW